MSKLSSDELSIATAGAPHWPAVAIVSSPCDGGVTSTPVTLSPAFDATKSKESIIEAIKKKTDYRKAAIFLGHWRPKV
jgi:hypothetical protein